MPSMYSLLIQALWLLSVINVIAVGTRLIKVICIGLCPSESRRQSPSVLFCPAPIVCSKCYLVNGPIWYVHDCCRHAVFGRLCGP
jgi:hypothetical protein